MSKQIDLTEDEFDARFTIIESAEDGSYHSTFEEVKKYHPAQVWTAVDGDDGGIYLLSGLHLVNRFAYVVTEEKVPEDESISTCFMEPSEDEEEEEPHDEGYYYSGSGEWSEDPSYETYLNNH